MPEGDQEIASLLVAIDGGAVHHHYVEFAIVVAVEEADASAHRFDDVVFFARGDMRGGQAGLGGDVAKDGDGERGWGLGISFESEGEQLSLRAPSDFGMWFEPGAEYPGGR